MAVITKAPRGTQDILPSETYKWQFVEKIMMDIASLHGFKELRTPTFEHMELFKRSVGDTTDVVQKEMYQVKAEKGEDLYALKPEGTAGAVRSAIEKGLLKDALPLKIYYNTSCFRHERPQAGRYREFHQFGIEVFGASTPNADVEVIATAKNIFDMLGLKNISLFINSIGCPTCRKDYTNALVEYFKKYEHQLCATCLERMDKNPMRILDCKSPVCSEIAENAPTVLEFLCEECNTHFDGVKARLQAIDLPYQINPKIVRGLDYYTKTVFEFVSEDLGAQSTVCGGGRYDGLVEQLGGDKTAGLGFGIGIERLLLVMQAQNVEIPKPIECEIYIASMGESASIKALELCDMLRKEGFYAECDLVGRSLKAQMKYANKINSVFSMVLGDEELGLKKAKLKNMQSGEQLEVNFEDELTQALYDANLKKVASEMAEQYEDEELLKFLGNIDK